ncbi:Transcription termination factor, mitochondrial/chloroplastic [Dillenia turbinata]|uniref:Transcription termination factor, mitochondrial/chloroplastic n=1 Tax=Dillenia turbinata TaxID=194707 RepID=A0AAN8Z8R4_9MAGN
MFHFRRKFTIYPILQISTLGLFSTSSNPTSLTLQFLTESCNLSPQSALKASKQITLKSTQNPNSVLTLFKNHNFTDTHITKIVTKQPNVLLADPDKTLKPRLDFLIENGISGNRLGETVSANSDILTRSLERQLIPFVEHIKTYLTAEKDIATAIGRSKRFNHVHIVSNVDALSKNGVPNYCIAKLFTLWPEVLTRSPDAFREAVEKIKEMGFDPSSSMFIRAVRTVLSMNKELLEAKFGIFLGFGWSREEVDSLFRKQPWCVTPSEEKLSKRLRFLMEELKWRPDQISKYSAPLFLDLEKRTMPRCMVLQALRSKGLIVKESQVARALLVSESSFLKSYVIKHQEVIPQILEIYNSERGK